MLSIDIETYCKANLSRCGIYRYTEDDSFEVLLFAYSVGGQAVHVVDLACGSAVPEAILDALDDPCVEKWAFNAAFERVSYRGCCTKWDASTEEAISIQQAGVTRWCARLPQVFPSPWRMPVVHFESSGASSPAEKTSSATSASPACPTKANGGHTRNLPAHAPER